MKLQTNLFFVSYSNFMTNSFMHDSIDNIQVFLSFLKILVFFDHTPRFVYRTSMPGANINLHIFINVYCVSLHVTFVYLMLAPGIDMQC